MTVNFTDNATYANDIDELKGSPAESGSLSGVEATATILVPWSLRWLIVDDIVGLRRSYPHAPSSGSIALSASITPFGASTDDGQGLTYEKAQIAIKYGQLDGQAIDGGSGTVYAESLQPSAEFTPLNFKKFRWGSASGEQLLESEAPGKLEVGLDYVQKQYQLSTVPAAVLSTIGNVNSGSQVAAILGLTFPAETLLYTTPTLDRTLDSAGNGKWDLTMAFSYKPNGWNKFWRADTQAYDRIYIAGGVQYNNYPLTSSLPLL